MSTLVCFHAHPDDEAISTGGLMRKAADAGHRVVLVCATQGEQGEVADGVLHEGETLWERRVEELIVSCEILGAEPPRFLGYEDSGMIGTPENDNPASFWQADHDEAVERLVDILTEVDADVLTIYDDHGGYGHPDHLQVHRVGLAAGRLAGIEHIFEATINRDAVREFMEQAAEAGGNLDEDGSEVDPDTFGTPAADIAYQVDVSDLAGTKRNAMKAHGSQIGEDSFFLTMPEEVFAMAFGVEWFNVPGRLGTGGPTPIDLLPGLD